MLSSSDFLKRRRWFMQGVAALTLLATFSLAALAQGPPPNLDFNDNPNGGALYRSTGRAFIGTVNGNIYGRFRDGRVRSFDVLLVPFNVGPGALNRVWINYNESTSRIAPTVYWYDRGTTKHVIIKGLPARQDFSGTSVYSSGTAEVQLTFVENQPGKAVVIYRHQVYSVPSAKVPSGVRAYSGTVFSGSPLNGRRLYFELR